MDLGPTLAGLGGLVLCALGYLLLQVIGDIAADETQSGGVQASRLGAASTPLPVLDEERIYLRRFIGSGSAPLGGYRDQRPVR